MSESDDREKREECPECGRPFHLTASGVIDTPLSATLNGREWAEVCYSECGFFSDDKKGRPYVYVHKYSDVRTDVDAPDSDSGN
jgi:hypothetical protein